MAELDNELKNSLDNVEDPEAFWGTALRIGGHLIRKIGRRRRSRRGSMLRKLVQ